MNAFYEHHKSSIEFVYRCFDRILLNGLIQPFQQPERVLGFFNTGLYPLSRLDWRRAQRCQRSITLAVDASSCERTDYVSESAKLFRHGLAAGGFALLSF